MEGTSWAERTAQQLSDWIRQHVNQAGGTGVVFGLSGGVDSAVVAGLAKRAFPDDSLGLILPCHSMPEDASLAREAARAFELPVARLELDSVFDLFEKLLREGENGLGNTSAGSEVKSMRRLALANVKPRLRMIVLYYYANLTNRLVLGTGNETEITVGYFTKHGDGGVDLFPLGNLVKREVYSLAEFLGVPREIIEREPSAGLWPGQTDEGEIGLTYDVMDAFLRGEKVSPEAAALIEQMERASAHKRATAPVAPVREHSSQEPEEA